MLSDLLISLVLLTAMIAALSILVSERKSRVSACPSLGRSRRKMLDLLQQHIQPVAKPAICELGCGWGGLVAATARRFPDGRIVGFERSIIPLMVAKLRFILQNRVVIRRADFFREDLSSFDIVLCYLSPWHMEALKPQFQTLKPGSLIVSNSFSIPGCPVLQEDRVKLVIDIPLYIYCIELS